MPPVGFEPTISAGERPQTYALDRAATGTGCSSTNTSYYFLMTPFHSHALRQAINSHLCSATLHFISQYALKDGIARGERDGTRAETRFRLSPKRKSPFKSVGASVQSTAGSRGVRISLSNAG